MDELRQQSLEDRVNALERRIANLEPFGRNDGWIPFDDPDIYFSGWEDYLSGDWDGMKYRRKGDMVQISGICKRTSGASFNIATLPIGYRPWVNYDTIGTQSVDTPTRIYILTTGVITMINSTSNYAGITIQMNYYSPIPRRT